jgi:hypothetical protein
MSSLTIGNHVLTKLQSIKEIINVARKRRISPMGLVEKIAAGRIPDIQPSVRSKVKSFVKVINSLRECVNKVSCFSSSGYFSRIIKGISVADLLREVIVAVKYEEYLKESQKDWAARFAALMSCPRAIGPINGLLQVGKCPGAYHIRDREPVYQEFIWISGCCLISVPLTVRASRPDFGLIGFFEPCADF